jgi:hypothetical protein
VNWALTVLLRCSFASVPVGQLVAVRKLRWLGSLTESPVRRAFALGWCLLFLAATQLAAFPGSDHILKWVRLLTGLAFVLAGVSQLRTGVVLRRRRRAELLQTVATVISALARHRREELSPDQG